MLEAYVELVDDTIGTDSAREECDAEGRRVLEVLGVECLEALSAGAAGEGWDVCYVGCPLGCVGVDGFGVVRGEEFTCILRSVNCKKRQREAEMRHVRKGPLTVCVGLEEDLGVDFVAKCTSSSGETATPGQLGRHAIVLFHIMFCEPWLGFVRVCRVC